MPAAIPIVAGVVSVGASIWGAASGIDANQRQYNYEQQQAQLAQQQREQQIQQLQSFQGTQLSQFKTQQATQAQSETAQLGTQRQSLNQQVYQGGMSLLGQEAGVAGEASTIQSSAAARGMKVGSGAPQAGIAAAEGTAPTGGIPQLRAYESGAAQGIGAAKSSLTTAAKLGWGSIAQEQSTFAQQQQEALTGFTTAQSEQLQQAQLGNTQATAQEVLASQYQASQLSSANFDTWLSAFSDIVGAGTQAANRWNPSLSAPSQSSSLTGLMPPSGAYDLYGYGGW